MDLEKLKLKPHEINTKTGRIMLGDEPLPRLQPRIPTPLPRPRNSFLGSRRALPTMPPLPAGSPAPAPAPALPPAALAPEPDPLDDPAFIPEDDSFVRPQPPSSIPAPASNPLPLTAPPAPASLLTTVFVVTHIITVAAIAFFSWLAFDLYRENVQLRDAKSAVDRRIAVLEGQIQEIRVDANLGRRNASRSSDQLGDLTRTLKDLSDTVVANERTLNETRRSLEFVRRRMARRDEAAETGAAAQPATPAVPAASSYPYNYPYQQP